MKYQAEEEVEDLGATAHFRLCSCSDFPSQPSKLDPNASSSLCRMPSRFSEYIFLMLTAMLYQPYQDRIFSEQTTLLSVESDLTAVTKEKTRRGTFLHNDDVRTSRLQSCMSAW